jgi:hypothetical protein
MSIAYRIEKVNSSFTKEQVENAFNKAFTKKMVHRVDETLTRDAMGYCKSFTIFFTDLCVDDLFGETLFFHNLFDRYILYYNKYEYWDVYLVKVKHA